jgi:uncharacterized protein (DUF1800 family)
MSVAARRSPVTRRQALGGAIAAGAGVAAIRLWGGLGVRTALQSAQPGGRADWVSPLASEQARIAQLLRRTTFGASPSELEAAFSAGYGATVDRLLESKAEQPPALPDADGRLNLLQLQLWWVEHMLATRTPFAERLTLFWHGHFTSDFRKVGLQTPFLLWQNLTWRNLALGDLHTMLMQVTVDPAMLRYLDLATSTGANPNENYARELMELFTMGPGSYTEDDVRAAAKALAGWTEPRPTGSRSVTVDAQKSVIRQLPTYDSQVPGVFVPRRAYNGTIKFLGKDGKFDAEAVIASILAQPATAPFLVRKVLEHFVTPKPSDAYVNRLAASFRKSKYDLKTLFRDVFTSPEFTALGTYRALVKSPTEFMAGAAKALQAPQLARLIVASGPGMGQMLFDPPDVGGWPNNDIWVDSNNVIARVNFVSAALNQLRTPPGVSDARRLQLDGILSPATTQLLGQARDDVTRWFLLLASPEFQLK